MATSSDTDFKLLYDSEYEPLIQRVLGTIYGQCVGDAIGLLTEFLTKSEAKKYYETVCKNLELEHKEIVCDMHRVRWKEGDWTDDSDQMVLILLSLLDNNGEVDHVDFAKKLKNWTEKGFRELGDFAGLGIGTTTSKVVTNPTFTEDPHAAAELVWDVNGQCMAPNGAVMRTSILGIHRYQDIDVVAKNAIAMAKVTHADPRCQASAVAVSVAIALMLQRNQKHLDKKGHYDIKELIHDVYEHASKCLKTDEQKAELKKYLKCQSLKELHLDEAGKIGYTYKSMGSGFWALKQDNFRTAIQNVTMEGGDADTNACVAGALLGCKLGMSAIPTSWRDKLRHKQWLDRIIQRYFDMVGWRKVEDNTS